MVHYCLRDDRQLAIIGNMKILGNWLDVCRCSGCGEITFWEPDEQIVAQKKLEQAVKVS